MRWEARVTSISELADLQLTFTDEEIWQGMECGTAMGMVAYGRRFGRTRRRYLDMMPARAVVGDFIILILGARTLFVLRKVIGRGKLYDCWGMLYSWLDEWRGVGDGRGGEA